MPGERRRLKKLTITESLMGGPAPRWLEEHGGGLLLEETALERILERLPWDARSLAWLTVWAERGPDFMSDVLADDERWLGGSVAALLRQSKGEAEGEGESGAWYAGDQGQLKRADAGADTQARPPRSDLRRRLDRLGPDLSVSFGSHPRAGDIPAGDRVHDPADRAGDDGSRSRAKHGSDGALCACRLPDGAERGAVELLQTVARCRSAIAVRRGIAGSFVVRSEPLLVLARRPSQPRPRWEPAIAFRSALRRTGSGKLAHDPRCGLCGLPGVLYGGNLREWIARLPL